jgi:hypothetical protein
MAEFAITGKHISYLLGVGALVGMGITGVNHFQSRAEALAEHTELLLESKDGDTRVATYDEVGNLENQIRLTRLEIKQIHLTQERRELTIDEASELDYLDEKLLILESRLLDLQRDMKAEA